MGQPLGYFSLSHNNELIKDIAETFGDGLDKLSEADTLWLIARIAHEAWQEEPSGEPPTAASEEIVDRLHELSYTEKQSLLQALCQ